MTVQLQPWGVITGRVVDDEGQPRGGVTLLNLAGIYPRPPADQGLLPGAMSAPGISAGRDGRFRVEGLVPGLKYGASGVQGTQFVGQLFKDVTVAPGEVKDLGDLKGMARRPGD
jgi:hypothetical protein